MLLRVIKTTRKYLETRQYTIGAMTTKKTISITSEFLCKLGHYNFEINVFGHFCSLAIKRPLMAHMFKVYSQVHPFNGDIEKFMI